MPLLRKNLGQPDSVRSFNNGNLELFTLGDNAVGRSVYQPGWRWSTDVKAAAGTDLCEVHHRGLTLSGRLHTTLQDGSDIEYGPNDLFDIPPGHDAWVVGDEPWVAVDFFGH
jgi:hypothetical protein